MQQEKSLIVMLSESKGPSMRSESAVVISEITPRYYCLIQIRVKPSIFNKNSALIVRKY